MAKKIGPILAVIGSDTRGFTDGLSKAQKQLQQFSSTAAIAGVRATAAFASTFGVLGAFALKTGADFELAFANVRKTVEGTPAVFEALETQIRSTAKEFGIAATEIADLARIGGQLGIAAKDLDAFTKTIAKLSIAASELDPETAARGLARLAALTKEGSGSIEKMANVIAKLGDTLPTTESRILDMSTRLASFGAAIGLTSQEIIGLGAGFSALVGGTERAATAVERFLGEMATAVASNGSELQAFADLASKSMEAPIESVEAFTVAFETRPLEAIQAVLGGMETLGKDGLAPLLQSFDALGITGVRMLSTFAAGAKGLDTLKLAMAAANKEAIEQGKLQKELSIQLNTVSRQFDRLREIVKDVGIDLFKAFKQQIDFVIASAISFVEVVAKAVKMLQGLGPVTKFAILGFIGLLGAMSGLLVVLGTIGGLVVGLSSLMTTLGGVLFGTGTVAAASAVDVALFGASTAAASTSVSLFSKALAIAKTAWLSFLGPVAAGIAVFAAAFEITQELTETFMDMENPVNQAAQELGFFSGTLEGAKVVLGSLTGFLVASKSATDQWGNTVEAQAEKSRIATFEARRLAEATRDQGDAAKGTVSAWIDYLNPFGQLIQANTAMELAAQENEQRIRTIGIASELAGRQFKTLGEALKFLSQTQRESLEASKKLAEEADNNSRSGSALVDSIQDQVAAMKMQVTEEKRVSDAAKVVGLSLDELNTKMGTNKAEWLSVIEAEKRQIETAKKVKEELDSIRESINAFSLENTKQEFDNFATIVRETMSGSVALTDEGIVSMVASLRELADAAGIELPADLKEFADATDEIKTAVEKNLNFDAQVQALQALSDEAANVKFEEFQAALVKVIDEGAKFSEEAMLDMLKTIDEGVERSGTEALAGLADFLKQANAMALAKAIKVPIEMTTPTDTSGAPIKLDTTVGGVETVDRGPVVTNQEFLAAKALGEELKVIDDQMKAAKEESTRFGQGLQSAAAAMQLLGVSADSSLGRVMTGLKLASKAGADFQIAMLQIEKIKKDPKISFDSAAGINAGIAVGESLLAGAVGVWEAGAGGGIAGAIGGAVSGAKFGASVGEMLGPIGAAAGAAIGAGVGLALSLIRGKPEFKKIMEDIGRDWGVEISEELAKEIEATAERLDIGRFEARLLSLGDVIGEAGGVAAFGMEQATKAVGDLFNAVETGVVPAEEGISEIGEVFGQMASEIFEAGKLADSGMLAIIARSRQLGIEVPEITAFITQQLEQAAAGISKLIGSFAEGEDGAEGTFGGIQVASLEDAQAQATIFAAGFFATLKEQGLLAAVDAFEPAFGEMKKKFEEFGADVDFGGIQKFFDIASNPEFRPLLEGIQGLTEAMTGLGNAGFLTADTFSAMQQQGGAAFEQLQAAGLGINESLLQMAPFLQEAINASQQFGFALDEDTQKMIEQAEAAGIAFKTDPMMQVVEVLKLIAGELGVLPEKLADIGPAAQESADTTATAYEESTVRTNEAFDGMAVNGEAAYDRLANAGQQSAQETSAASEAAAKDTVAATEVATEATKMMWTDTKEAVGVEFEGMKENILGNYETIIESTIGAGVAVASLGETAFAAVSGFDAMAEAAKRAESAAKGANSQSSGGDGGGAQAGQFGLTTTVNEPTTFIAGEAGQETVTIDPGGDPGGGGSPGTLVLQIDGKTFGKIVGDLSRTGDVRIHPSSVEDFG